MVYKLQPINMMFTSFGRVIQLKAEQFVEPCMKTIQPIDKWKYTVILDEIRDYLNDCNKKALFIKENEEKS